MWRGLYFRPETWDAADVFVPLPKDCGCTIVTERVREALMRAKITNISFERLTETERWIPKRSGESS